MSVEKAKEFLIKATTDDAVATRAGDAYLGALQSVASELGYDISAAELQAAMDDLNAFSELSEAELDAVAGGGYWDSTLLRLPSKSMFLGSSHRLKR